MNSTSHYGERLREERKRLGLSQDAAATRASVSREMWGKYERGVGMPGGDVLTAIAQQGFDINYVLTGSRQGPAGPAMSKRARAIADAYDSLNAGGKRALESVVAVAVAGGDISSPIGGQVFHGTVGNVVKGDAKVGEVHMNIHSPPPKKK